MELRTILYGYEKRQFAYFVVEKEAKIVQQIFSDYLSGKSLLSIAKELTDSHAPYYKDRTTWTKAGIRRILENEHYLGDEIYPPIINAEIFQKAKDLRLGKGGDREKDCPEVHYLKQHTRCLQCGGRYTRINKFSTRGERWLCINRCKTERYLSDEVFYGDIIAMVNGVIVDPDLLKIPHGKLVTPLSPSVNCARDFHAVKEEFFDYLAEQFDECPLDPSYAVTDALIEHLQGQKPINKIDLPLFKIILREILVDSTGEISLKFVNGAILSAKDGNNHG